MLYGNRKMKFRIETEKFIFDHAEELAALSREAYHEHLMKNIKFAATQRTAADICRIGKNAFLACALEGNEIVGCVLFYINRKNNTAHGENFAVKSSLKGQKIGSRLAELVCSFLAENKVDIYQFDTSSKTPNVINFHKKYGSKVVGMVSWPNTNYYSVILRKAINPNFEISDLEAEKMFRRSEFWCKKCFNENGSRTMIGGGVYLMKRLLSIIKKIWK